MKLEMTIRETKGFLCSDNSTFVSKEEAEQHQRALVLAQHIMEIRVSLPEGVLEDLCMSDAIKLADELLKSGRLEATLGQKVEVLS